MNQTLLKRRPENRTLSRGKTTCRALLLAAALLGAAAAAAPAQNAAGAGAPYVDSKAVKERFDQITAADMDMLRQKKILFASRSFGLNLWTGLNLLAKQDPKYDLVSSYQRYDVFKAGGDVGIIPPDAFQNKNFVHFMATHWPLTKRIEEMNRLLTEPPREFGKTVDVVVIFYHTCLPEIYEPYTKAMAEWQAKFPKVRFIYVASGLSGPKYAKQNESSFAFGEKVRAELRGKVPVYDMGAILSDDFRDGHVFCPEYSSDPAELHPNLPAGEIMMAKGFLLVLKEAFAQKPAAAPAVAAGAPAKDASAGKAAALPPDHPDVKAVRAILDANGLTKKAVDGVSVIENGRIVGLFLQEGGITELPDQIGTLTALRKLHLYGDRNLLLPRLKKISPAIGRCTNLEELLLTQNELETLPAEIANLQQLRNLSIADNRLHDLPPAVVKWAQRFDPNGLADQKKSGR